MVKITTAVNAFYVDVKIGAFADERKCAQTLKISFKLYQNNSKAAEDDEAEGYNCYAELVKAIKEYCVSGEFKLLEYLC